jgi:O-antigen/teichoic acid export membrane protein
MRNFLRGLSAVTLVNVINGVLGIVIVPIAVKRLGIEGYGLYSIFSVLAGYLVLVELGLGKNLVRLLGGVHSEEEARSLLRLALGLYVAIAAALVLLSPLLVPAVEAVMFHVPVQYVASVYWITGIAIVDYLLGIPVSLRLNYALSRERMGAYARFMLVSNASRYALMVTGVLLTTRPELAVAFVLGRRLVDLTVAPRILPHLPAGSWHPRLSWREGRALMGESALLALNQLLNLSTVAAGSVLVNWSFGLTALGIYRSTFDLVSKVWFFSNTAGTAVYPRFIQLLRREESRERLGRILPGVLSASWLTYCLFAAVGVLIAPIVPKVMHLGSTPPVLFALLIVGVLWNAHAVLSIELLQASGQFRVVGETAAVSFTVMTAVFLILARRYPAYAIGWAWVVSQFISTAFIDAQALRHLRGKVSLGPLGRARLPGAVLACAALAWLGGVWTPPLVLATVLALVAAAAEARLTWGAIRDLTGGPLLTGNL